MENHYERMARRKRLLKEIETSKKSDWKKFELTGRMRKAGSQVLGEILFSVDGTETILLAEVIPNTDKPYAETFRLFAEKIKEAVTI